MDEKTEELRDIFIDVAGEETVTEAQAESRGSLTDVDEDTIDERLAAIVADMRERYDFESDLESERYVTIVRGFYDGEDDATIADAVDAEADTVFTARMDLHLVSDEDADAPFEMGRLRDALNREEPPTTADLAAELDADTDTVAHFRTVAAAQNAARRVSHRFQSSFEDALTEANLAVRLTADVQEDGLDDATEDMESNVSF